MRVLQVVSSPQGGIGAVVRKIAESSSAVEWHVAMPVEYLNDNQQPLGPAFHYHPLARGGSRFRNQTAHSIKALCDKITFDIVHAHALKAGFHIAASGVGKVTPLVYTGHSVRHTQLSGVRRVVMHAVEMWVLRQMQAVTFLTESESKLAAGTHLLRQSQVQRVIPNCIDLEETVQGTGGQPTAGAQPLRAALGCDPASAIIGACGRLDHAKNPELYIEVARRVLEKTEHDVHFVWLGHGEPAEVAKLLSTAGPHTHAIHFVGQQPNAVARRWMHEMDVFLMTSRYEGMPFVLLEAMSSGCAIVVPGLPSLCDIIQHGVNGLVFEPGNAEKAAACILELIANSNRAAELAAAAKSLVTERYSPSSKMGLAYCQLYSDISKANSSSGGIH